MPGLSAYPPKEAIMSEAGAVVLVHGGFVDGSGWQGVYDLLKQHNYEVSIVQNPRCHSKVTPKRSGA
jgi:hypothetical protein